MHFLKWKFPFTYFYRNIQNYKSYCRKLYIQKITIFRFLSLITFQLLPKWQGVQLVWSCSKVIYISIFLKNGNSSKLHKINFQWRTSSPPPWFHTWCILTLWKVHYLGTGELRKHIANYKHSTRYEILVTYLWCFVSCNV